MKQKFFTSVLFAAFAALFVMAPAATTVAHAASEDSCTPSATDLKQITTIQNDPTLSYTDEIKSELAVRKQLLRTTIMCAENEVTDLQTSLGAINTTGSTATLQSQLSSRLSDAINFYNIELAKLDGVGISGSKAIAREVLSYRAGSYGPLASEVNNFMLWFGSQDLFATAQSRMDQTARAVSFLLGASPDSDLQNAFAMAQTSFGNAVNQNKAAENALVQSLPPDQSLALIQQSLASLADTYHQFFTVSNLIKTVLPQ